MRRDILGLAASVAVAIPLTVFASGQDNYEVWAIDQSNSPGLAFGGTLHIWDGADLERGRQAAEASVETIDLGGAAAALCLAQTGTNPVRPHTIAFNTSQTHAIISFVASGPRAVHGRGIAPAVGLAADVGGRRRRAPGAHVVPLS